VTGWTVIVPAKPWRVAKSRLDAPDRVDLARAFALDVLDAVAGTPRVQRVVVVSAERGMVTEVRERDLALVADRPYGTTGGLNSAVGLGWRWAQQTAPDAPVVVVPADLPCLTPATLTAALQELGRHDRAFVPDLGRGGTTLVSASAPAVLTSAYGSGSAQRHERLGLTRVASVERAVRRDVDTAADLAEALALGVGPRTAAATRPATPAVPDR